MSPLKRTVLALGLLVLLKVVGIALDKFSPYTLLFHNNLITALQLFVFLWLILSFIVAIFTRRNPGRAGRWTFIILIVFVALMELLFQYWLKNPAKTPAAMQSSFKQYYIQNYRNVVQVVRSCSEFDSNFFYRLRPNNQCTFGNIEFSNQINTNSIGARDDENSLTKPDVICIGDSYTMGWGVNQNESFPAKIEQATGLKVLNAGMSSFGTVREVRKLASLDTSNCKWVVLQYCDNDIEENRPYVDNKFQLQTSGAAAYDTLVKRSEWNRAYYPGKTFFTVSLFKMKEVIKNLRKKPNTEYVMPVGGGQTVTIPQSAKYFAETIAHNAALFQNRQLIVLYAYEGGRKDSVFIPQLQQLMATSPYREAIPNIHFINTSNFLGAGDSFIWDDHFNAKGHEKIANEVVKIISGR